LLSLIPTTTAVTASTSAAVYSQPVIFTAVIRPDPPFGIAPTGTVTFYDGSTALGTQALSHGVASIATALPGVGEQAVTARYSGDGSFAASASGEITIIAGDGTAGFRGDGGPATAAELNQPFGMAVDAADDVFLADSKNNAIREIIKSSGKMITVAGSGQAGYSGDGGPATQAKLDGPLGVAVDAAGDLFIADSLNNRVREVVVTTGDIITLAGDGSWSDRGDGGPAAAAELADPHGVVVDASGNLFIADTGKGRIREVVAATGDIITVAGDGSFGDDGDGGPATDAAIGLPGGLTLDAAGDLFIADFWNDVVREVDASTGMIRTVAGKGGAGFRGDAGPAADAGLYCPLGLAVDGSGNLFIADSDNGVVREVVASTALIFTVAGIPSSGPTGDGGSALATALAEPSGVAVDGSGDLFITDSGNNRVLKARVAAPVEVATDATAVSLETSASSAPFGQAIAFTAIVTAAGAGSGVSTGTVIFTIDNVSTGVPVDPRGQARLTIATLGPGSHTITASYAGGAGFLASQSGPITEEVVPADTRSVFLSPIIRGHRRKWAMLDVSARVESVSPGAGMPTGTITFLVDGRLLVVRALEGGKATIKARPSWLSKKAVTIVYGGDTNFRPSAETAVAKMGPRRLLWVTSGTVQGQWP
jgi:sugar lactone lactonase YvrE